MFEAQERLCSLALNAHPLFEQPLNRKKSLTCLLGSMHPTRLKLLVKLDWSEWI